MPRLIFKCPYIKGGTSSATAHLENYVKYMATRNGVERIDPGRSEWPATSKQKKMVEQILRDFPLSRGMFEYWDSDSHMTYPLILAKIPVKNPWEIFAYLPFGNWNECPDTPELMAVAKYWFQRYGAIPAAMSHDELEFLLPAPVSKEMAMEVATEQYGFCPDIVDQEQDDPTVGNLADVLWQSTVWYFWWD